jgi:hypothetical protein
MSSSVNKAMGRAMFCALALGWVACGSDADEAPAGTVSDLTITRVTPEALVPGSVLAVEGNFVDLEPAFVELVGSIDGAPVNALLPASLTGLGRLEVKWNGGIAMGLPLEEGTFQGELRVSASVPADPREHRSTPWPAQLRIRSKLEPVLYGAEEGIKQVNDAIRVEGSDFLLGGGEGTTVAILEGCYQAQSATSCKPFADVTLPVTPDEFVTDPGSQRKVGSFPFAPKIAGIEPGVFQGTLRLRNDHVATGASSETAKVPLQIQIVKSTLTALSPSAASLGQYVDISGGGFVGKAPNIEDSTPQATRIELVGTFTPTGQSTSVPVNLQLVTEFVSGKIVRYVLNEEDALGQAANLRKVTGEFKGTAKPVVSYGAQNIIGDEIQVTLGIAPIKQVVWVNWLPTYKDSLENLGLRAADQRIRDRILESMAQAYIGINVEFRAEEPRDFKLYTVIDLEGPDPNGLGLLGYDNSPGKDKDNLRLADKIGGVNALTQEGGYPGYGGVFVDSLMGFSMHPGKHAQKLEIADPLFDEIFDPFRPDRGGHPILAEELATAPILTDGSSCPAKNRQLRIGCAIWVFGSMVGTTAAHELAHSLGLAEPDSTDEFHNPGDEPNRLMDSGGARTFRERAELGEGPGVFCDDDYKYLKGILPAPAPDPLPVRPPCR